MNNFQKIGFNLDKTIIGESQFVCNVVQSLGEVRETSTDFRCVVFY